VRVGDQVKAGQTIATVNEGEGDEGSYLYFEIRENNRPVNPKSWLRP
jgi:septal ring factor EnvC (AmiA/AmiB activator)